MELTNCIICNSTKNNHFIELTDRLSSNSETFKLVKCECGFVFLNPRPDQDEISNYYKSSNYDPHANKNGLLGIIYKFIQYIMFYLKYKIICNNSKLGKILDIGGGMGEFAQFMNKKKWNMTVHDKFINSTIKSENIKINNNLNLIKANNTFNIITLWHSLEHIHDIPNLFSNIRRLLDVDGTLIIAVPNLDALERSFYNKYWAPYDAPRHLYHFNLKTIEKLCINNNFKIIKKYSLFFDTAYNIFLSLNNYSFKSFLKAIIIYFYTLTLNLLNGPTHSSSFIIVCKKL